MLLIKVKSSIYYIYHVIKLFSISLSFLMLFQSIGITLNDISQIDEIIEHIEFHNEEYGDNFFVFISKHYGELKSDHEKKNHNEKEDHEKLPFQSQSNLVSSTLFTLVSIKTEFLALSFSEFKKHDFFYNKSFSTIHLDGLFQPPQQV